MNAWLLIINDLKKTQEGLRKRKSLWVWPHILWPSHHFCWCGILFHIHSLTLPSCHPASPTPNSNTQGTQRKKTQTTQRKKTQTTSFSPFKISACIGRPPLGIFFHFPLLPSFSNAKRARVALCFSSGFAFIGLLCLFGWVQLRLVLQEATQQRSEWEKMSKFLFWRWGVCGKEGREITFTLYENTLFSKALFKSSPSSNMER